MAQHGRAGTRVASNMVASHIQVAKSTRPAAKGNSSYTCLAALCKCPSAKRLKQIKDPEIPNEFFVNRILRNEFTDLKHLPHGELDIEWDFHTPTFFSSSFFFWPSCSAIIITGEHRANQQLVKRPPQGFSFSLVPLGIATMSTGPFRTKKTCQTCTKLQTDPRRAPKT